MGLMSAIDNLLLFRCIQIVRRMAKQERRIGIFCNLSPASLGDEDFFPQFLDFLGQNRDLSGALIFELGQKAFQDRTSLQARIDAKSAPGPGGRAGSPIDRQRGVLLDTVRQALAEGRVDLYLQPVVSLPQRRTAYYESFSRLRDESGRVMMPAEYLSVAEPEGLMSAIDNLLLFRCVQIVRRMAKQDRRIGIFCNISPASLGDEDFFPQFLDFLGQNRDLSGALIFELGQKAFQDRSSLQARHMAKLADLGFRFSIDKVVDVDLDFADLSRSDVRFVKIGAKLLLEEMMETPDGVVMASMPDIMADDYAALTRRYGVELIAEKVEAEREVIDILELDISYGQGHLFGEPRAIKETVLAEASPPPTLFGSPGRRAMVR